MSLFFRRARGKISVLLPYYVDDTLACGDNTFAELTNSREILNESKAKQGHEISGVYVDKCDNGFEIHQRAYIERLEPIPLDAGYMQLR